MAILACVSGIYAWDQKNEAQKNLAQSLFASGINKLAQNEYGDPAAYIATAVRNGSGNAIQFAESMLAIKDDMVLLPNLSAANTAFSPNGRHVAGFADMGDGRFELQLWDAHTRKKLADIKEIITHRPHKPAFDRNNNLYIINDRNEIIRYQPNDQKTSVIYRRATPEDFALSGISPDGQWLALREFNRGSFALVSGSDARTGLSIPAPRDELTSILFSPDGKLALMLAEDCLPRH